MFTLQRLSARILAEVLDGRSLDAVLRSTWAIQPGLTPQDRALVQDLSYGTLRFLGEIDAALDAVLERPLQDESIRHLLRVALYQLLHTRAAPHAIVDHAVRACAAAKQTAAKGLVNAVLRNVLRRREAILATAHGSDVGRYSHPQWWIDKLRSQHPSRYRAMLDAANRHPPLTLRVNRRRTNPEQYLSRLHTAGIAANTIGESAVMLETPLPIDRVPGFSEGEVSVQDAAAQFAARLLDVAPGMRVLDACAAPGGKTAHILECADVELVALDNDSGRLPRVQSNLTRLGLTARLLCGNAAEPDQWWDGKPYTRILADVPCSASGVVRRHPDIKWLRRSDDLEHFAERQRRILDALWQLLSTDGKLLYVTCSVFHEENNIQAARFLERHQDAQQLALPEPHINVKHDAGQIFPDDRHDGFFYALLQKL